MQIIENNKIKEKVYIDKLNNGLNVVIVPKKIRKKYVIWATEYGSIDNHFMIEGEKEPIQVPDGIAHYLEHKLFEQKNGRNSLDVLSSLGVDANAYTTNNHTAYLFECTDHFYEALDEFMDYVQNPYFTDENVEKERGIIGQEIMMYADYPEWTLYMNAIKNMYHHNEINIDVAGTQESIAKITKDSLYTVYHTFYRPENMVMVIAGDFIPEKIIEEVKKRITMEAGKQKIKRIYQEEPNDIVKKRIEKNMEISIPCFMMAFKDVNFQNEVIRKDIAIDILGDLLFGKSTNFYKTLYEEGKLLSEPSVHYEFAKTYAHVLIQCQTNAVEDVIQAMENRIEELKKTGINEQDFAIVKRKIYGDFVRGYNDIEMIANGIVANYFRNIDVFDYFEEFDSIDQSYVEKVLKDIFLAEKEVISVINPNERG